MIKQCLLDQVTNKYTKSIGQRSWDAEAAGSEIRLLHGTLFTFLRIRVRPSSQISSYNSTNPTASACTPGVCSPHRFPLNTQQPRYCTQAKIRLIPRPVYFPPNGGKVCSLTLDSPHTSAILYFFYYSVSLCFSWVFLLSFISFSTHARRNLCSSSFTGSDHSPSVLLSLSN